MSNNTSRTGGFVSPPPADAWEQYPPGTAYRCEAHVSATHGKFTATAATLAGVTAEGATEKEALDNLTLALATAIAERKRNGEKVSTEKTEPPPEVAIRYVLVRL